ncbi:MAG: hypothetical protein R6U98_00145, partial [Pirellulaceae bacterium]
LLQRINVFLRLFEDLTFREIRGHQIKYDFVLEKTGLETRPTYTVCNVRVELCQEMQAFRRG